MKKPFQVVKSLAADIVFHKLFSFWENLGFHLTTNQYDSPIPDTRTLNDQIWLRQRELVGIDLNEKRQIQFLAKLESMFKSEYHKIPMSKAQTNKSYQFYLNNGAFQFADALILYCMIRYFKPKRVFEVGSGNSTYLIAEALLKNKKDNGVFGKLISYEPYPNDVLKKGFPGLSELNISKIQDVDLARFDDLEENDILFIDSSHVLKIGSDVHFLYLEVLPKLKRGVNIHIHDIFMPYEYPRDWVLCSQRFWTEQYLLQALLTYSRAYSVLWAGNYMRLKYPDKLRQAFDCFDPNKKMASFWIRKEI